MRFSIIVVCLNAGTELRATIKSILTQDYSDFEIIIKDGGSTDGSIDDIPEDSRIRFIKKPDSGIYDAMNQALEEAKGEYVYFLNCGDYLYDATVLANVSKQIDTLDPVPDAHTKGSGHAVIYGDILERISSTRVMSNPVIDEFACYRNVPCHQACFYNREMLLMHPFNTDYKVRADYEQFLWAFFIAHAKMKYMDMVVASYMGGGFSESKEGKNRSRKEHAEIVENYMPHSHVVRYKWRMILSMAWLRGIIAKNPLTAKLYNNLKSRIYSHKTQEID